MNREEAIAILQAEFDKSCGDYSFQNPAKLDREDALWTAISALQSVSREQIQKVWRGEWLDAYDDFSTAKCSNCGDVFDVSDTFENLKVLFEAFKKYYRFCPACGAAMTDNAVEMMMKRLEAMYGEAKTD